MRLTRKPRLFGSNARRLAGASAMLLALAPHLAGAQEVPADAASPHGVDLPLAPGTASSAGPLGWTAAGAWLAMALWAPRAARSRQGA